MTESTGRLSSPRLAAFASLDRLYTTVLRGRDGAWFSDGRFDLWIDEDLGRHHGPHRRPPYRSVWPQRWTKAILVVAITAHDGDRHLSSVPAVGGCQRCVLCVLDDVRLRRLDVADDFPH